MLVLGRRRTGYWALFIPSCGQCQRGAHTGGKSAVKPNLKPVPLVGTPARPLSYLLVEDWIDEGNFGGQSERTRIDVSVQSD